MNKNLFFLCFAAGVIVLSIICITIAPIINKHLSFEDQNCQLAQVSYERYKNRDVKFDDKAEKLKEEVSLCKRRNAMHDLEYTAFIIDIVLGFICSLLGLIHYLDAGKNIEKYSGLIGLICGVIITILTIIYVGFSADIFTNDIAYKPSPFEIFSNLDSHRDQTNDVEYDPFISIANVKTIKILYQNKAEKHWNGEKYIHDYDESEAKKDYELKYIKYKDLGKKQYNYDSEIIKLEDATNTDSILLNCLSSSIVDDSTKITSPKDCDYIWTTPVLYQDINNKFLYDRWLTTIILSVILSVLAIGMSIFGFLLFKNSSDSSSSPDLIPNSNNNA